MRSFNDARNITKKSVVNIYELERDLQSFHFLLINERSVFVRDESRCAVNSVRKEDRARNCRQMESLPNHEDAFEPTKW